MKRIHLFEFEDQSWFPGFLRSSLTRLIVVMHRIFGTAKTVSELLEELLLKTGRNQIVDLCSGSSGPMVDAINQLREKEKFADVRLTMTDLFPSKQMVKQFSDPDSPIRFLPQPIDAADVPSHLEGLRTMICSFHHMDPDTAKSILQSAAKDRQPIFIFELSDNSVPMILPFLFSPVNVVMALVLTPLVRPITFAQILFTYLIPIIPLTFAWDGVVSNARTYTQSDIQELLEEVDSGDYRWETRLVGSGGMKKMCVMGWPEQEN